MNHETARLHLGEWLAGRLEADTRREVERHLADCAECMGDVDAGQSLASALGSGASSWPGGHPPAESLVAHALREPPEDAVVAAHVKGCEACAAEAEAVRRAEAEVARASPRREGIVRHLLVAAALLLAALLVHPAYLGLVRLPETQAELARAARVPDGPLALHVIEGTSRSAGSATVQVDAGGIL